MGRFTRLSIASLLFAVSIYYVEKSAETDADIRPSFVAIIVSNLDSSQAWYKHVLKIRSVSQTENRERNSRQANLLGEGVHIELIELSNRLPAEKLLADYPGETAIQGIIKFGFTFPDFDQWYKALQKDHVHMISTIVKDDDTGKRCFLIHDPDGNLIQFFEA